MSRTLIESFPKFNKLTPKDNYFLRISEMFSNTIQGEGITSGVPAMFMRLQYCTLACKWCDTLEVWKQGNPYSIKEVLKILKERRVVSSLKSGHHLIITGGSPLKQEESLKYFIDEFIVKFNFKPFIEIENECVLMPQHIIPFVDLWNNSPKLSNSGMKKELRYKPNVIKKTASLNNSIFKFVVSNNEDWKEIKKDFIDSDLIARDQIILMPEGQNQEELNRSREFVVKLAIKNNVSFSDRLHITLWDKKTGV